VVLKFKRDCGTERIKDIEVPNMLLEECSAAAVCESGWIDLTGLCW
jgi:hypothetical protein